MFTMINDQSGQVAVLQHRGWWGGGGGERSNNEGDGLHCLWYCPLSGLIYLTTTWCCDYHLCVYKFVSLTIILSGFWRLFEPLLPPTSPLCTSDGADPNIQVLSLLYQFLLYNVPVLKIFEVGDLLRLNANPREIMRMIWHQAPTVFSN